MKFEKSVDDLLYQMANDRDVIGRRWAMAELEKKASGPEKARIVDALITSAEKDAFWRIRRAALSVIANIYSPDPPPGQPRAAVKLDPNVEAAVVRLANNQQNQVRGDAIELLGETKDKKFTDIFVKNLESRSYEIIEQSSLALARVKDTRAYPELVKLTTMPSWRDRIQIAAYGALGELGDKRAFDAGYKAATDKSLPLTVRTAALTVVASAGKGDPRAFSLIFENFKKAYDASSERALINSIDAIIRIADPRGQEAFDMLKKKFKDNAGAMQYITSHEAMFKSAIAQH
jgi:hypothetical protein